ncbi:MAG: type II toxin-antitoxin system VapC family toxin [Candidatus Bathyarchaeia archaeon]
MKLFLDASFLIYLNSSTHDDRKALDSLFHELLSKDLYTNLLVIDETLYISKTKYGVPYNITLNFFKKIMLPYVEVIPIDESDIEAMEKYLIKYDIKPSDAIHLATMEKKSIAHIVSEDEEFDRIKEIHRIWLSKF